MKLKTPFKILCALSIISWAIGNILIFGRKGLYSVLGEQWSRYIFSIAGLFIIVGVVLVIIVLSRYPQNKVANILIKIYVAEIVIIIAAIIVMIIYNLYIIVSCCNSCVNGGCSGLA